MTIWEQIFKTLKENDIEVYPPATKKSECKNNYVVIKRDGGSQIGSFSSERIYYQFMLYVPANKYETLDSFEKQVKDILYKLYPAIMDTGSSMSDYYDEQLKAHMRSFLFRNNVRNKNL